MKCTLMNKNTKVLQAEYDDIIGGFTKIYRVYNMDYAPYILKNCDDSQLRLFFTKWFNGRGIPSWRDQLDILLHRLNIHASQELLNKAFGLSLSDQYWLKPDDMDIQYDDINFFDHDFDYSEILEASLSKHCKRIENDLSLKTPNNTTDGMLKKAWVIENGIRYLVKGGYKNETLQPFNEVLASEICTRLGFYHVPYTLDVYSDMVVSKCPCFVNKDTEFIPAYQVMYSMPIQDYEYNGWASPSNTVK